MTLTIKHRYRNRQEIIYQVLQSIGEHGSGITKIIYGSYCSFIQAKEYLDELLRIGLVTYDSDRKVWKITNKGLEFIKLYSVLRENLGESSR